MKSLAQTIRRFPQARVLVIGDLILDEYIWGAVERISPEAPVPVVWAQRHTHVPGGAANVANNIRSLDAQVCIAGVTGSDRNAQLLRAQLASRGISTRGIFAEPSRHTTVKTRVIAGHQQLVRIDWEHTDSLPRKLNAKIISFIRKNITQFDAVIIEDYGKGVVNPTVLEELVSLIHRHKKAVTVDPKEDHFQYYRGATTITPNRKELENAVRNLKLKDTTNSFRVHSDRLSTDKEIDAAALQIIRYLDLESLLVTLGEQGMRLFERNGRVVHIPTVAQEVFDVSGAGDTVVAAFTLAVACGAAKPDAARIANYAAGIVVSKLGTAVTSRQELLKRIGGKR